MKMTRNILLGSNAEAHAALKHIQAARRPHAEYQTTVDLLRQTATLTPITELVDGRRYLRLGASNMEPQYDAVNCRSLGFATKVYLFVYTWDAAHSCFVTTNAWGQCFTLHPRTTPDLFFEADPVELTTRKGE